MLSLDQVRKLLDDASLTDEQILEIRDACGALATLIIENWLHRQTEEI